MRIYYGDHQRAAAMDELYSQFIKPGDLVFDIGAHVGDRIASFRRLGAKVVAVEPQPSMVKVLLKIYGKSYDIKLEPVAVGSTSGEIELRINVRNPTISTSSMRLSTPRSTRPVTTVPRPSILNTSSMHIRNGLSTSRVGNGIEASIASISS